MGSGQKKAQTREEIIKDLGHLEHSEIVIQRGADIQLCCESSPIMVSLFGYLKKSLRVSVGVKSNLDYEQIGIILGMSCNTMSGAVA